MVDFLGGVTGAASGYASGGIGGAILGGISGAFGSKGKRGPSVDDQLAATLQAEQNSFKYRMSAAKEYGISKLAMLGVPSFNAPSFSYNGGNDYEQGSMGQNLSRAAAALGTYSDRKAQEAITGLQIEGAQLDNEYKRSLIRNMTAPGTPPASPDPRYPNQGSMPMGYGDTAPLLRVGRDAKGNPIRVYNDDLGDNEVLQGVTAFGYSIPDWIHGNITKPSAAALRRGARRLFKVRQPYYK